MLKDIYLDTREAYIAGSLHSTVAIARLATDKTFIAEADLDTRFATLSEAARQVVLQSWRGKLVKATVAAGLALMIALAPGTGRAAPLAQRLMVKAETILDLLQFPCGEVTGIRDATGELAPGKMLRCKTGHVYYFGQQPGRFLIVDFTGQS